MDELEFNLIDLDLDREKTELYLLDKDIFDFNQKFKSLSPKSSIPKLLQNGRLSCHNTRRKRPYQVDGQLFHLQLKMKKLYRPLLYYLTLMI